MRKNRMRRLTIAMLTTSALACCTIGLSLTASADVEAQTVTIADKNAFCVVENAEILLRTSTVEGEDHNGMRFTFEMSETQFTSLLADAEASTKTFADNVSVGALVVPTSQISGSKTGDTVTTADVVNCAATASQEISIDKWKYADSEVQEETKVYYACAYLYNLPNFAYAEEISSCAYITIGENTVYTDVYTSTMSYVAGDALRSGECDEFATGLKAYFPTSKQVLYSIDDATLDLTNVKGTVQYITDASGNEISFTETDSVVTVSGDDVLNNATPTSATGAIETITVYTSVATYNLPLKVCTDVIDTAAEFDEMKKFLVDTTEAAHANSGLTYCKKITGYYALGSDIDFATVYSNGYASPFSYTEVGYVSKGNTHGWMATFDGNGHTISNLNLVKQSQGVWCNSLFGIIADSGRIANVAFKDCSLADGLYNSAFLANFAFGSIENVYLDVTLKTTHNNSSGNAAFVGMAANQGVQENFTTATISNVTVVVDGLGVNDYVMKGTATGVKIIKGSFVIIGADETKLHSQYATLEALTTANANIKAYTGVGNASQDSTLTACGSTKFTSSNGMFTIKWNGETVHEEEIVFNLAQQLYSIDDATVDLSGVSGTVTGIKDTSGNEIAYTLDGTTATVSGDDVLNSATPKSATGAVETITVYTSVATYNLPLKVCTDVIDSASEFDEMKKFLALQTNSTTLYEIKGYYALGKDIDFNEEYPNGYSSPFSTKPVGGNGGYHGWNATFDGNGHKISNLKLVESIVNGNKDTWTNSLFGIIGGGGGKIMNVAFVQCSIGSKLYNSAFLANQLYGTIENVYLDVTLLGTGNASGNAAFVGMAASQGVVSGTISNVTVVVDALGTTDYVMKGTTNGLLSIKGSFVIIGADETKLHSQYATLEALTTANAKIKVGTTSATSIATCGSATFATTDNTFTIKWNGNTVYEETIATE